MLGPSAAQSVRFFSQEFFNNMDQLNTDDSPANLTKGMNANLLLSCNELSAYYLIDIKEGRLGKTGIEQPNSRICLFCTLQRMGKDS